MLAYIKSDSHLSKEWFLFNSMTMTKPFNSDEKCFLFHVNSSFRSQSM